VEMMLASHRGLVLSSLLVALLASGCTWFSRSSEPAAERGTIDSPGADVTFANDQKKARDEAAMAKPKTDATKDAAGGTTGDAKAGGGGATVTPLPSDSDSTSGGGGAMADKGAANGADKGGGAGAKAEMDADGKAVKPGADAGGGAKAEKVTLQGDALFKFGKADEKSMLPGGKQRLDELADKILAMDPATLAGVVVIGHADRLGSPTGNMKVSSKRAETVKNYLVPRGVDAAMTESMGKGDSDPVAECPGANANKALIACLSPNRRVEVIINTK
jgi:outer membrane protein OmpA-like peptidoglycan-associated protein